MRFYEYESKALFARHGLPLGPRGVALGSDFDGAFLPSGIGDATGLPRLVAAMQNRGVLAL